MDRISPNFICALILTRCRFGLLPVIFHKFVIELWALSDVFCSMKSLYNGAIVRFSDNSSCAKY